MSRRGGGEKLPLTSRQIRQHFFKACEDHPEGCPANECLNVDVWPFDKGNPMNREVRADFFQRSMNPGKNKTEDRCLYDVVEGYRSEAEKWRGVGKRQRERKRRSRRRMEAADRRRREASELQQQPAENVASEVQETSGSLSLLEDPSHSGATAAPTSSSKRSLETPRVHLRARRMKPEKTLASEPPTGQDSKKQRLDEESGDNFSSHKNVNTDDMPDSGTYSGSVIEGEHPNDTEEVYADGFRKREVDADTVTEEDWLLKSSPSDENVRTVFVEPGPKTTGGKTIGKTKSNAPAKTQAKPKPEPKPEPKPPAESQAKAKTKPKSPAKTKPKSPAKTKPKSSAKAGPRRRTINLTVYS